MTTDLNKLLVILSDTYVELLLQPLEPQIILRQNFFHMKRSIYLFLFSCLAFSCSKKNDDPAIDTAFIEGMAFDTSSHIVYSSTPSLLMKPGETASVTFYE